VPHALAKKRVPSKLALKEVCGSMEGKMTIKFKPMDESPFDLDLLKPESSYSTTPSTT
jgi:hypothetical protein